jgi:hypothetical protein
MNDAKIPMQALVPPPAPVFSALVAVPAAASARFVAPAPAAAAPTAPLPTGIQSVFAAAAAWSANNAAWISASASAPAPFAAAAAGNVASSAPAAAQAQVCNPPLKLVYNL